MNDDFYTSEFRAGIQRSMASPWTPRPLYSTKAQDTTPRAHVKRTRRIKRLFWHLKDDLGLLVLILAVFGAGVAFWLALAQVERWIH